MVSFTIMAITLLAACLAVSIWRRRESFFDEVVGSGYGSPGPNIVDATCSVSTDNTYYNFDKTDGLQRHPNIPNTCFFSHPAQNGIMLPNLRDCAQGSAVHHEVVESISVEPVQGDNKCVMKLKTDLSPLLYEEYEKKLLNLAIDRSIMYNTTLQMRDNIRALIVRLQSQRDEAVMQMQAQQEVERTTLSQIAVLKSKIMTAQANVNSRNSQNTRMDTVIADASASLATYQSNYDTANASLDKDNTDLQALNAKLATARNNIGGLTSQIASIDAEIARLNKIISSGNNNAGACRSASAAAAAESAIAAATVPPPAPAPAPANQGKYIKGRGPRADFCLDVQGVSKDLGAQVYMWGCWNGPNQRWTYDDKQRLVSENSGMCLDVWENNVETGAEIKQYPCHDGANQRWTNDDGMLKPAHAPGMCLDVWEGRTDDGSAVKLYPCHGGANQRFDFYY